MEPRAAPQSVAPPSLPFAHLNLRHNPFGEPPFEERASLAVVDIASLADRLRRPGFAVQFLGDKGRGKTTHLLALHAQLEDSVYIHIPEDAPVPAIPPTPGSVLLIDEAQRLPQHVRRRALARPISFVIGSHADHTRELRAARLDVETIRPADRLSARLLCDILNRRIEWARRAPGAVPRIRVDTAHALIHEFGDDIRSIEGRLYDVFQELQTLRDV